MNRRKLKKAINDSMTVLYAECLYHELVNNANQADVESIKETIEEKHNEFISRVSLREGIEALGGVKPFYAKLWEELNNDIRNLDSKIAELKK